jgi:DNA-directed RNA polymerase subunit RPC12/RpoP
MSIKTYRLYCTFCGYKRITDGTKDKDLVEVKTSPMQITLPILDPITHKTIEPKFKKREKRFKCPKCGRVIFPKKLKENDEKQDNITGYQSGDEGQEVQGNPTP